jgi:hypothetical protein
LFYQSKTINFNQDSKRAAIKTALLNSKVSGFSQADANYNAQKQSHLRFGPTGDVLPV